MIEWIELNKENPPLNFNTLLFHVTHKDNSRSLFLGFFDGRGFVNESDFGNYYEEGVTHYFYINHLPK